MNKVFKYISLSVSSLLLFSACNVMDTKPFESYDEDVVWGSKETADAFVIKTYASSVGQFVSRNASFEAYTPNGVQSDLSSLNSFPTEIGMDRYHNTGFGYFSELRRCNMIIEKAQASNLSANHKKELIAEGHFLRGLIFYAQVLWQGRFVPITKVLSPEDTDAFKTPITSGPAESYKIIIDDFDQALLGIPETSLSGRANIYAVHAFRSRACLQAYAYTKDASYLDKCIESANFVINSGKYSIENDYGKMFVAEGAHSPEIILGYYRLAQNTSCASYVEMIRTVPNISPDEVKSSQSSPAFTGTTRVFEGWASYFPTQNLVDQYLVIDQADGKAKNWYETSQYTNSVVDKSPSTLQVGDFTTIATNVPDQDDMGANARGNKIIKYGEVSDASKINEIMYQNRDKRFYGTIVYDSCVWVNNQLVTTCCQGNLWAGVRTGSGAPQNDSWYTTASGYYWRKGIYEVDPRIYADNPTDYHFVLARLGEMYMNLAEAYLLKNNVASAITALNVTRTQHGGLPASTASNLADAWKDYIRERRVEMAYECGDIYWSYLRWGQYGGPANYNEAPGGVIKDLETPPHKIQISKNRKKYFVGQIVRNGAWQRTFTPKRYLMPIPQSQLDKRSASGIIDPQNPGW